jgi:6-phosphogluconolactonase (cycloisomerase 2 family)
VIRYDSGLIWRSSVAGVAPPRGPIALRSPTPATVESAHDGPGNASVSAFADAADGTLTSIGASPFHNGQTASCWVEITHDGQYLFAVNTAVSTISRYSIAASGSLTSLGFTPLNGAVHGAEDARLSPDGTTLWVVDAGSNAVSGFAVNGGTLTELGSSPTPGAAGATPSGIVVT